MNLNSTIYLFGIGTSEGVRKEWDTRGRKAPEGVGFASPNVEENLSFQQALAKLNTPEEQQIVGRANELVNQLFGGGEVHAAVGDWSDGAENSSVTYAGEANSQKMDYMMATLGKEFNQKAVISFIHDPNGDDGIANMNTSKSMDEIRDTLDKGGIKFRTLIPEKDGTTTVQVFDQGGTLVDKIAQTAMALNSSVDTLSGTGKFIGGDSREEAQEEYEKIIRGYNAGSSGEIRGQSDRYGRTWSRRNRIPWRSQTQRKTIRRREVR